ncbi:type II toxin-antitoxin system CcdA family antitoxin [Sphingomonas aracearum]|uniref:Post-segregation antitoxin CcdA n=1 Tax=Sphingomonas aracearum TaxID=2283317 RepID=A0A369VT56_9SPHN|nr:type II toxin-antitoxin system CcdA family antitoxin [Sphingomonas aracearum]RDE04845.1 post-segregation antitoxin CcdA [Sphingomonas aracearum]
MKQDRITPAKRRPVNLSLDTGIVAAAREVGINLSQVSEAAIRTATRKEQERRWQEENRAAMESSNAWVEKNGLPFAKYRMF